MFEHADRGLRIAETGRYVRMILIHIRVSLELPILTWRPFKTRQRAEVRQ
jgi:hypothetical protein